MEQNNIILIFILADFEVFYCDIILEEPVIIKLLSHYWCSLFVSISSGLKIYIIKWTPNAA